MSHCNPVTSVSVGIEVAVVQEIGIDLLLERNDEGEIMQKNIRDFPRKETRDVLTKNKLHSPSLRECLISARSRSNWKPEILGIS
jgi:hypothetical protein